MEVGLACGHDINNNNSNSLLKVGDTLGGKRLPASNAILVGWAYSAMTPHNFKLAKSW